MPSEKRARQRAYRQARMAELRRAQQRRRQLRRGGVVAVIVVLAVVLAIVTTSGGGKHKVKTTTPPELKPAPAQLAPAAAAALNTVPPPPTSAVCAAPAPASTPATTVPASGNAVAKIPAPPAVPFPNPDGSSPHYTAFTTPPPFCIDVTKTYTATMVTDVGPITIQLLPADAPVAVNNFVFLAGYHYFDGMVFHRVIPGFVDQGGDPTGSGAGGPGYKFNDELPKSAAAYDNGAVAMANSGANTNGSQFFLVIGAGGQQLAQPAYTMFGQIVDGINVATKINSDGTPGSGTPPKVIHHILKVTISQTTPPPPAPATTAPATTAPATTAPATTAPATTAPPSAPPST